MNEWSYTSIPPLWDVQEQLYVLLVNLDDSYKLELTFPTKLHVFNLTMPCTIKSRSNSASLLSGHFSLVPRHYQQPLVGVLLPLLEIDFWQYLRIFANICNKIRSIYFLNRVQNGIPGYATVAI
jgi:hypothetical protein